MSELTQALVQIKNIRRQVAQTTEFRGYGPSTLFATALIALAAGAAQAHWVREPATHALQYVALWLTIGVCCATLIAIQMLTRTSRLHSGMAEEMIRNAVLQFLPAGVAGLVLPLVLLQITPAVFWMLPGLWLIIFSLGVFASCRSLPRSMWLVGTWFLVAGFACILLGDNRTLAPTAMSGGFAIGMTFVAAVHYFSAKKVSPDDV